MADLVPFTSRRAAKELRNTARLLRTLDYLGGKVTPDEIASIVALARRLEDRARRAEKA